MKKVQLPVIGGVRKVIQPGSSAGSGTTIAEIGNGTVTLEQLAAAIFNILSNTGTVNTAGQGQTGVLVVGPGLSGGGVLTGNVPLRLTAPIPWGLDDGGGGADGDIGPPGPQGVMGSQGPQGIPGTSGTGSSTGLVVFVPEDPTDNDTGFLVPGPVGPQGVQGSQGPAGASGTGSGGASLYIPYSLEDGAADNDTVVYGGPGQVRGGGLTELGPLTVYAGIGTNSLNGSSTIVSGNALIVSNTGNNGGVIVFPNGSPSIVASAASAAMNLSAGNSFSWFLGGSQILSATLAGGGTAVLTVLQAPGNSPGLSIIGNTTNGASQGLTVKAGTNINDFNFKMMNTSNAVLMELYGDGSFTLGSSNVPTKGNGTIDVTGGYFVNGVPLTTLVPHTHLMADDTSNDDGFTMMGRPNVQGPTTVQGSLTIYAAGASAAAAPLIIVCGSADFSAAFSDTINTQSFLGFDANHNFQFGCLNPNYGLTMYANNALAMSIFSTNCISVGALGAKGATPAVTAAQTDIGITTTGTVITTAGGIALPALASTFWVVNVNGVKYGVPLFAL